MAVAVLVVSLAGGALAQKKGGDKASAKKFLASGDRKFAKSDYDGALADYKAAYEAYPDNRIYYAIAGAEEKLGRHLDAFRHYSSILEEGGEVKPELRRDIQRRLEGVKKHLAAIRFAIEPSGATIFVDGHEIGTSPLAEPHWVKPGKHTYTIRARGYTEKVGAADLSPGEVSEEAVELERDAAPTPAAQKKPSDDDDDDEPVVAGPSRIPLIVGIGGTIVLAGATTFSGLLAVSEHDTFADDTQPFGDREEARSDGKRLALTTDILLAATLSAAAFTGYYYFGVYRPRKRQFEQTAVWWGPRAGDHEVGLAVGGRF